MSARIAPVPLGLVVCLVADLAGAADWPRFRGPDGSGTTTERVPTSWSDTENVAWRASLPGKGSSSPIVVGDRVFVTCFSGGPSDLVRHVLCFDKGTGEKLWSQSIAATAPEDEYRGYLTEHGYATSTPVSDGERLYVFFGKSGVYAFDLDGRQLWNTGVGTESSSRRWGSGASLVLHGDHVIVNASEESQSVRALDKRTGEEAWKSEASSLELVYNTPLVLESGNGAEVVIAVPYEIWGLNAETGKLKWYAETDMDGNVTPSLVTDGQVVYGVGGRRGSSAAVRIGGKGDVTDTHVVWTGRNSSYVPSPVLHEGRLYWVDDRGTAYCVDAKTGENVYRERLGDGGGRGGRPFYASLLLADGKLYAVSRRNGTYVYAVGPQFRLLGRNTFDEDRSDFNASPAVSDGRMYLRSDEALYCLSDD